MCKGGEHRPAWLPEHFETFGVTVAASDLSEVTAGSLYGGDFDLHRQGNLPPNIDNRPWRLVGVAVDSTSSVWVEVLDGHQTGRSITGRLPEENEGLSGDYPTAGKIGVRLSDSAAATVWILWARRRSAPSDC